MVEASIVMTIVAAVIIITATIVLGIVCRKRRDLLLWLVAYVFIAIGITMGINPDVQFSSIYAVCNLLGILLLCTAVIKEYYQTFFKDKKKLSLGINAAAVAVSPIVLGLRFLLLCFVIFTAILLVRIYLYKRTPTHAFMGLTLVIGSFTLIISIFANMGVEEVLYYPQAVGILLLHFS